MDFPAGLACPLKSRALSCGLHDLLGAGTFFKNFWRSGNSEPQKIFTPLKSLENLPASGFFSWEDKTGRLDFFLFVRRRLEILFVAIDLERGEYSPDIFPGTLVRVGRGNGHAVAGLARQLASRLGIEDNRVIFFAVGAFSSSAMQAAAHYPGAWCCCHKPLPPLAPNNFEVPAQDLFRTSREYIIAKCEAVEKLFPLERRSCQAPLSSAALVAKTLNLAGIHFAGAKAAPISVRQIFLHASSPLPVKPGEAVFLPGKYGNINEILIEPPWNWDANPWNDNNWQAQLQMWRPLDGFILNYAKTSDPAWLEMPVRLILDWHGFYLRKPGSAYVWADMTTGMRAMKIAWFLALHYAGIHRLRGNELRVFQALAASHMQFMLNEDNIGWNNHTFMDLHGIMALAQVVPPWEAMRATDYADRSLKRLLAMQFDGEGVHQENSPQYQQFGLSCLERLARTGWFDTELDEYVRNAREVLEWMRLPDGRLIAAGDTDNSSKKAKYRQPEGNLLNRSGYVIMREGKSCLFFMCARHNRWHKHSDDLSIVWHDGGDILCDPGKYAYQESEQRDYVLATRAHNTLEIDGRDEYSRGRPRRPRKPLTLVEMAEQAGAIYLASAIMFIQEFDVTHRRRVVFRPGKFLLVADDVFSTREHEYNLHWLVHPDLDLLETASGWKAQLPGAGNLSICLHTDATTCSRVVKGQRKPRMLGFFSPGYKKLVPACCLEISATAACWKVATAFGLNGEVTLHRPEKDKYALRHGNDEYFINMAGGKFLAGKIGG